MLYHAIDSICFLLGPIMNSSIINILEILNAAKTLSSVGFSSGYNFDEASGDELFDELISNANLLTPIFSGIIIIETSDEDGNFTIIDGLQRITTLKLLLIALCEVSRNTSKRNEEAKNKIFTRYLTTKNQVKLQLTGEENEIYNKIVFSQPLTETEARNNLFQTYQRFLFKIKKLEMSPTRLFRVISKIQFMVIFVNKSDLSTRELYQSLNENKSDLSQINLITSFISQSGQASGSIWQQTMNEYTKNNLLNILKQFMKDFLTVQNNGRIPSEKSLYRAFKNYFITMLKYQPAEQIIGNLHRYSQYYLKIIRADFEDSEIQNQIAMINENNGQDTYAYLMEVLDDLENSHIERGVFLDILSMISKFVITRRDAPPSDLTMNFANLSRELNKKIALKDYTPQEIHENKLTINELNHLSTFEL